MTNKFNVIAGDVHSINDTHNTIYVSKYSNDSDNQKQMIPIVPQLSSMGGGNGLIGGQQRLQVMLPTGSVAYDVNNSAFKYIMRFFLDLTSPFQYEKNTNSIQQNFFGWYTLYQGCWYYQPAVLVVDQKFNTSATEGNPMAFDPSTGVPLCGRSPTMYIGDQFTNSTTWAQGPVGVYSLTKQAAITGQIPPYMYNGQWVPCGDMFPLSSGPLNSTCVFYQTQVQGSGLTDDDMRIFRRHLVYQLGLDPHIQDTQYFTWFMGTKPCITFSALPYVIDQCPTLQDGTTPNPRYGTRVADGRFWNVKASSAYNPVRPVKGQSASYGDVMTGNFSGSWIWGSSDTATATYQPHAYPDLTCGYTYDIVNSNGVNIWVPRITPTSGGMNEIISVKCNSTSTIGSARFLMVQNVEFSIPLRHLNCVFDTNNPLFYGNALRTALFSIWLTTHQQNMCDVWGNSRMFGFVLDSSTTTNQISTVNAFNSELSTMGSVNWTNNTSLKQYQSGSTTAMVDAWFFAEQKSGNLFNSDLSSSQVIANKTSKMHWTGLGTFNANMTGIQNYPVMKALKNMKNIQILVSPNDTGCYDNQQWGLPMIDPRVVTSSSLYLHQHSTLMTENQFLTAMNQQSPDIEFNYFGDFNIRLSNKPTAYMYQGFGAGIKDIRQFMHETLSSKNLICNTIHSSMPYMFQYGDNCILNISAEKFKNLMNQDISFDGVDTTGQPVMLQWAIYTYDPANYTAGSNTGVPYNNDPKSIGPALHTNGYIMETFQEEENWIITNPMNGTIQKVNDVRGMGIEMNSVMM